VNAPQLTPAQFRSHFPITEKKVYLASCSQGALSDSLSGALAMFQSTLVEYGNPWDVWVKRVERARVAFAELIGARSTEIAIVSCASEGAFQVASSMRWDGRPGLVTTELEFPSIANVWLAQRSRGAQVQYASTTDGLADADGYARLIDDSCSLVSVPLNTYINGQRLPVREVTDTAHRFGARVIVDAYQGLGIGGVDVNELGCDYLVCGALKYLLGVPGIAFLYVREGLTHAADPSLTGWFGQRDTFGFDVHDLTFADTAKRFQSGSPPVIAAYGALAGLSLLAQTDPDDRRRHIDRLVDRLHTGLLEAGESIGSPHDPALRGPQVAVQDRDPVALAAGLSERGVIASPRSGLLRIAFHYYNSADDVDACLEALAEYRRG
jgi:selenocysteine lyase/cysteine desulfurase